MAKQQEHIYRKIVNNNAKSRYTVLIPGMNVSMGQAHKQQTLESGHKSKPNAQILIHEWERSSEIRVKQQ